MLIPYQLFLFLIIMFVLTCSYAFKIHDRSYYTDIITILFSAILAFFLSLNSIIGVQVGYALKTSVTYTTIQNIPLALIFACVGVVLIFMFVTKIIDVNSHMVESID